MGKKITHKEHKKHVHHVLLYVAVITGLFLTITISLVTYKSEEVYRGCADADDPNNDYSLVCFGDEVSFGWPFKQVASETYWPSALNWVLFSILVFAVAKTEAHHKGHIPKKFGKE